MVGENALYHLKVEKQGVVTLLMSLVGQSGGINGDGELLKLRFRVLSGRAELKVLNGQLITVEGQGKAGIARIPDMRLTLRAVPAGTSLGQNFPNPFNPETWIPFVLGEGGEVKLRIYDVKGRIVKRLDLGYLDAGYYNTRDTAVYWDGRNDDGEKVASGVYIYQLQVGERSFTKRMVISK